MFPPADGDETKQWGDETIFGSGEDIRKPGLVTHPATKRRAERPNDWGPSS
jgi:hypothetical protein